MLRRCLAAAGCRDRRRRGPDHGHRRHPARPTPTVTAASPEVRPTPCRGSTCASAAGPSGRPRIPTTVSPSPAGGPPSTPPGRRATDCGASSIRATPGHHREVIFRTHDLAHTRHLDTEVRLGHTFVYAVEVVGHGGGSLAFSDPVRVVLPAGPADGRIARSRRSRRGRVPTLTEVGPGPPDSALVVGIRGGRRSGLDERALVEAARHDPDAFAELYRRHVAAIHAFAHRRSGSTRRRRGRHRRHLRAGPPQPAPLRVASERDPAVALPHRRQRTGRSPPPGAPPVRPRGQAEQAAHPIRTDPSPSDPDDDVLAALSALRPRYQEVLALRYLADLDPEEVAAAVGISRPHLAVLLRRARIALRRALDQGTER